MIACKDYLYDAFKLLLKLENFSLTHCTHSEFQQNKVSNMSLKEGFIILLYCGDLRTGQRAVDPSCTGVSLLFADGLLKL